MSVSEHAAALGVRTSALRHWDAEGLVVPDQVPPRGTPEPHWRPGRRASRLAPEPSSTRRPHSAPSSLPRPRPGREGFSRGPRQ
ncbi:MerR family transcriptional regulator [Streptomyces sp. NPDC002688]|uniref:MerR family transcriptional regulator n=1 Tax=Streptomyces sp. NPDC002688 TaxID=3154423 RepID=UPI003316AFEF